MDYLMNQADQLTALAKANSYTLRPENVRSAISQCSRFVFVGIGKSAHVAGLMADTFASLGIRALYINGNDILHGSSGYIEPYDAVIFISNSGRTKELIDAAYCLDSTTETCRLIVLSCSPEQANWPVSTNWWDCTHGLGITELNGYSPTTSTLVFIAVLNQLAMEQQLFDEDEFRLHHPGGAIGNPDY